VPAWGLGHLRLDGFQLAEGVVSVQELVLVLPSGALIDVPGNTEPAAFNLNGTGASKTPLYVHLSSAFKVASVRGAGDPDEEGIERVVQRIELSAQPFSDTALQVFKLAEFERSPEGTWRFVPGYLPAMLRVTGLPVFEATQKRLAGASDRLERLLLDEIETNYLAGENQVSARECLRGLYEFRGVLADLKAGVACHPVDVYRALRTLYIHVSVYRGVDPTAVCESYQHETPGTSFQALLAALEQQVDLKRSETPYAAFSTREGMVVCDIPPAAKKARNVYWLVQKPRVSTVFDTSGIKLAGESRLSLVHQRALRGVAYQRIETPPFHHNFSPQVEFYRLSPGEEWDYALRDGRIAFFHREEMQGMRSFLYWRTD
jgi:type VI secretion system protein ImpJ